MATESFSDIITQADTWLTDGATNAGVNPSEIGTVIVPIAQEKGNVLEVANEIKERLDKNFRVKLDDRDNYTVGYKFNDWEMKGVPVRIEIGPKEIERGEVIVTRRDTFEKMPVKIEKLEETVEKLMADIQQSMFNDCKERMKEKTTIALNMEELEKNMNENQGFVKTMWCGSQDCEDKVKEVTGAPSRCIPFEQEHLSDVCPVCGKKATKMVVWGRQY